MKAAFHPHIKDKKSNWFLFGVISFYLFVAYHSSGFYRPDEHFQIIEFANYKLGAAKQSDLAWEYNAQIRSGIQPALCFLIFRIAHLLGIIDPYDLAFILRAITSIFAVIVIRNFIRSSIPDVDKKFQWAYLLLSYFLWFLPFINVRFSSEAWSGLFFLISLTIIQNERNTSLRRDILLGAVFGFAILFRYQVALLVLGTVLWLIFVKKIKISKVLVIAFSGLGILILGFFIDRWLYGQYTFTIYNYFYVDIIEDVASNYGVSPWYEIILYVINAPGPIGVFIFFAFIILLIRQPKHIILWASIPFLLVHAIIPHKELRYLFPVANLVPLLLILAYQELASVVNLSRYKLLYLTILIVLIITDISGLIVISTKGAGNARVSVTEYIHKQYTDKKVNVLYLNGFNPYCNWIHPKNTFYNSKGVVLTQIITIWQDNLTDKKKKGYLNLLAIPNNEITGPRTIARLKRFNLTRVFQSIPWIDQKIIGLYDEPLNDDNLMLYEFRD